jgi:tetratricopeptide (TPR) repeat protein
MALAAKHTALKHYASATKEYNKALTVLADDDSRKVYIYERQGWLALMSSDVASAEGFYLAAIYQAEKIEAYDKSAVNAYRGAAYCYEKDGDISSAMENYQLALKHATDKGTQADIRKKLQRLQAGKRKKAR